MGAYLERPGAYLTTAYFVHPDVICTGRKQTEYDEEGTGNTLLFQNGPSTRRDLIEAPLDLDSIDGSVNIFNLF